MHYLNINLCPNPATEMAVGGAVEGIRVDAAGGGSGPINAIKEVNGGDLRIKKILLFCIKKWGKCHKYQFVDSIPLSAQRAQTGEFFITEFVTCTENYRLTQTSLPISEEEGTRNAKATQSLKKLREESRPVRYWSGVPSYAGYYMVLEKFDHPSEKKLGEVIRDRTSCPHLTVSYRRGERRGHIPLIRGRSHFLVICSL